jgi:hypothetical protein
VHRDKPVQEDFLRRSGDRIVLRGPCGNALLADAFHKKFAVVQKAQEYDRKGNGGLDQQWLILIEVIEALISEPRLRNAEIGCEQTIEKATVFGPGHHVCSPVETVIHGIQKQCALASNFSIMVPHRFDENPLAFQETRPGQGLKQDLGGSKILNGPLLTNQ